MTLQNAHLVIQGDMIVRDGATFNLSGGSIRFLGDSETPRLIVDAGAEMILTDVNVLSDNRPIDLGVAGHLDLVDSTATGLGNATILGALTATGADLVANGTWQVSGWSNWTMTTFEIESGRLVLGAAQVEWTDVTVTSTESLLVHSGATLEWVRGSLDLDLNTAIDCNSGAELDFTDVVVTSLWIPLLTSDCTTRLQGVTLEGEGPWSRVRSGTHTWSDTRVISTTPSAFGVGLMLTHGAQLEVDGVAVSGPSALDLFDSSITGTDLALTATAADLVTCIGSTIELVGVTATATGSGLDLAGCAAHLTAITVASSGDALRLGGAIVPSVGGGFLVGGAPFTVDGAVLTSSEGDAAVLTGPGAVHGLEVFAPNGRVVWDLAGRHGLLNASRIDASPGCGVCVIGGDLTLRGGDLRAPAGAVSLRMEQGELAIESSAFSGAGTHLHLNGTIATALDTSIDPAGNVLEESSLLVSTRALQPTVRLNNDLPAVGATARVLAGAQVLVEGTTDALGKGPATFVEVFRQDDTETVAGESLTLEASQGGLAASRTIARDASDVTLVLDDSQAPSDIEGLAVEDIGTASPRLTWEPATDDHLPPHYEINLSSDQATVWTAAGPVTTEQVMVTATGPGVDLDLPGQGEWRITVTPVDASGNRGNLSLIDVAWDLHPPAVTVDLQGPTNGGAWFNGPVNVVPDGIDEQTRIVATTVRVVGGDELEAPYVLDQDGTHTVEVTVTDAAGHVAQVQTSVWLDLEAPTVPTLQASKTLLRNAEEIVLMVSGSPRDDASGVTATYLERRAGSDGPWEVYDRILGAGVRDFHVKPDEGEAWFRLVVHDGAGNQGAGDPVRVIVDNEPPRLVTALPADTTPQGLNLTLEDLSGVASWVLHLNGEILASGNGSLVHIGALPLGAHELRLDAVDTLGNAATYEATVMVGPASQGAPAPAGWIAGLAALVAAWTKRTFVHNKRFNEPQE